MKATFDTGCAPSVAGPRPESRLPELERVARQFEGLLVREMIRAMVAGSTENGFFGGGTGGGTWQEMFESGLSEFLGGSGGLGIAEQVYQQLEPAAIRGAGRPQEPAVPADLRSGKQPLPGSDR